MDPNLLNCLSPYTFLLCHVTILFSFFLAFLCFSHLAETNCYLENITLYAIKLSFIGRLPVLPAEATAHEIFSTSFFSPVLYVCKMAYSTSNSVTFLREEFYFYGIFQAFERIYLIELPVPDYFCTLVTYDVLVHSQPNSNSTILLPKP